MAETQKSDTDYVSDMMSYFTQILTTKFGATGWGWADPVTSVQDILPSCLVSDLRWFGRERNRVVRERKPLQNREQFELRCRQIDSDLLKIVNLTEAASAKQVEVD